jgi:hypothetical protein
MQSVPPLFQRTPAVAGRVVGTFVRFIVPTVIMARVTVPFPIPLIVFTNKEKSASRFDSGIELVAFANVYGIVMGSDIRTSPSARIPFPSYSE